MAKWRETVKSSIENEEPMYVRDTVYDRLLGLLHGFLHTNGRAHPGCRPKSGESV